MAPADSGIDPRYAAQFQRGFDPARHAAAPSRRGPVRLEGGPPPSAPRVPDPPRIAPRVPDPSLAIPESADAAESPGSAHAGAADPTARTWWDWLLPVFGVALIVIAFMLWWSVGTDIGNYYGSGSTDQWEVFLQQARYMLPGPLLTAGIAAVTGGMLLQALRPGR